MASLREFANLVRRTPLHPQWLLGKRRPPDGIGGASGVVLDVGAADRWIAPYLSPLAHHVALDYPATGNKFYASKPDVFADASRLPIADASVDNVICLEVIEHLFDPGAALSEIDRVLKPGGRAWISIPFMYPIHNAPYDFQRFTEYGLRREIARTRMEISRLERSGHALRTSALLACLSLAGGAHEAPGPYRVLLLPLAVAAIATINVLAWLGSLLWPDWPNLSSNYHLVVRKPSS